MFSDFEFPSLSGIQFPSLSGIELPSLSDIKIELEIPENASPTESIYITQAIPTKRIEPMATATEFVPTPTVYCPGAATPRLRVNNYASVCTEIDRVALREGPSLDYSIITMVQPKTIVKVIEGPVCGGALYFWKVRLPTNDVGWMCEGNYLLCPNN